MPRADVARFASPYGPLTVARCAGPAWMGWHRHDRAHLAIVLSGALFEETRGAAALAVRAGEAALLDAGTWHRTLFDGEHTLLVSLRVADGALDALGLGRLAGGSRWSLAEPLRAHLADLAASALDGPIDVRMFDAIDLALLAAHRKPAPGWLSMVRDHIANAPQDAGDLRQYAASAGRHPTHLSETFARAFGVGPSLFRQRARLRRAVAEARGGASLTEAAHVAGFADSAHLARIARRFAGTTATALAEASAIRRRVALARDR